MSAQGNGLIWFAGDNVKAAVWNERSALDGDAAAAGRDRGDRCGTSDALGVGRPLDPTMPDHPVCRPLLSLPEDLLSETRFRKLLQVKPAADQLHGACRLPAAVRRCCSSTRSAAAMSSCSRPPRIRPGTTWR